MDITGLQALSGSSGSPTESQAAASGLANDFTTFLTLLTTQLQNQDPLSPMETAEFTNQLVLFAGVEQQIAQNTNLEKLLETNRNTIATQAVSYLGKDVEVASDKLVLSEGQADFKYYLPQTSTGTLLQIYDSQGNMVREQALEKQAGLHEFNWDGTSNAGNQVADGIYVARITATDANKQQIQVSQSTTAKVTGIEYVDGDTLLRLGDLLVDIGELLSVKQG